jgi:hypothetical protein
MATTPTGQGPGRPPRRRHHTNRHDHEEKEEGSPAEAGTDADPANEPRPLAGHQTDPAISALHSPSASAVTDAASARSRARRARLVRDSTIDAALDAIVDQAPPLPYEDRARIAFLLNGHPRARTRHASATGSRRRG